MNTSNYQHNSWLLAALGGDLDMAGLLLDAGAERNVAEAFSGAIEHRDAAMLRFLIARGFPLDDPLEFSSPPLAEAIGYDWAEGVEILLQAGAIPAPEALDHAYSAAVARCLLTAGADPAHLSQESRRDLLGLPPEPSSARLTVTAEQFSAQRQRRFGSTNPELFDCPFWLDMIRAGINAYTAGEFFPSRRRQPQPPIWCAQRFGQSLTFLPDRRIVQIGGEHEDFYDPDFCIYNDVFVHHPDGRIEIFGYPEAVFPPTDSHSATLVGDFIYVIGCIGYSAQRREEYTPVYRLDLRDFHFEAVETSGPMPGWIYKHRAELIGERQIRISGGTIYREEGETCPDNERVFLLDLGTGRWSVME